MSREIEKVLDTGKLESALRRSELEPTFRDPAGRLHLAARHALRWISPAAAVETLAFLKSPFRAALEDSGELIASKIAEPRDHPCVLGRELWLEHPRIDPISYPWEWTTGQWRAAAELTLRIARKAIDAGWTLKDATPLNIVFSGAKPVLVDVLSLERRDRHSSVWLAYGQFVRTFLLPLVAQRFLNWPLQATLLTRDGYEPRALYEALSPWQRMHPDLLDVVTMATMFEGSGGSRKHTLPTTRDPELATHILHKRINRLGKQIRGAARVGKTTRWSGYQLAASHYRPTDTEEKQHFVQGVMEQCRPLHVLDIGANTGTYSQIAAEAGAQVVALDSDSGAVETLWRTATGKGINVTAMVANIARPTPAAGWLNREQLSLLDRLAGRFDLVLMLAVIHHLILREQVPLGLIGDLCAKLTRRWLVLEWVPPSDPMYQEWLRGREVLYGSLSEENLLEAFAPFFHLFERRVLGNGRVLLLFKRNVAVETGWRTGAE